MGNSQDSTSIRCDSKYEIVFKRLCDIPQFEKDGDVIDAVVVHSEEGNRIVMWNYLKGEESELRILDPFPENEQHLMKSIKVDGTILGITYDEYHQRVVTVGTSGMIRFYALPYLELSNEFDVHGMEILKEKDDSMMKYSRVLVVSPGVYIITSSTRWTSKRPFSNGYISKIDDSGEKSGDPSIKIILEDEDEYFCRMDTICQLQSEKNQMYCAFSTNSDTKEEYQVKLINWKENGKKIQVFRKKHDSSIRGITSYLNEKGEEIIVTGGLDGRINFWDMKGKLKKKIELKNNNKGPTAEAICELFHWYKENCFVTFGFDYGVKEEVLCHLEEELDQKKEEPVSVIRRFDSRVRRHHPYFLKRFEKNKNVFLSASRRYLFVFKIDWLKKKE